MITTLDEVICKRGERVWEIGITLDGIYRPTSSVVHGGYNDVTNPDRCWKDYDLCKEECDKLNNKNKCYGIN